MGAKLIDLGSAIERRVQEPARPELGWNKGDRDTYYSVQVHEYNDDDVFGYEDADESLMRLRRRLTQRRESLIRQAEFVGWPIEHAMEVGRLHRYHITYV